MRKIKYSQAINEAFHQVMNREKNVIVMGIGVNSPWYVGHTMEGLFKKFGCNRVIDTPVSENGFTGIAVGAAMSGLRPVVIHPRMDFMYYSFDQIINQAANWHYMFGGSVNVPLTLRGIVNRGGEQAAQHSQSIQALFMHIPGLKVVMPATPSDAKGLLISSVLDNNPVIYIDDRWLYDIEDDVPDGFYQVPIGEAKVLKQGKDVTIIASSYLVYEGLKAAEKLGALDNIDAELLDLRTIKPLDTSRIFDSVKKTGRVVIADGGWQTAGASAEVSALISSEIFSSLKAPVRRVCLPDAPAPASKTLEQVYYPHSEDIYLSVKQVMGYKEKA
ncbi:MAG: pyruvate dehydrogenase complex E1 component subunit beta [bacterium]|nr:pyruvate dehydrogenase complex E1 component subunit beta [bacterium]